MSQLALPGMNVIRHGTLEETNLLSEWQRRAIMDPAIEAEDCVKIKYKHYHLPWSVILTLNSGFE